MTFKPGQAVNTVFGNGTFVEYSEDNPPKLWVNFQGTEALIYGSEVIEKADTKPVYHYLLITGGIVPILYHDEDRGELLKWLNGVFLKRFRTETRIHWNSDPLTTELVQAFVRKYSIEIGLVKNMKEIGEYGSLS